MDSFSTVVGRSWELLAGFDPETYRIVLTSLKITITATLLASLVGVPLGGFIALTRFRGRRVLKVILNTLMALPTVVVGLVVYGYLSRSGPLGHWGFLFTPAAVVAGEFILALPLVTRLVWSAVEGADERLSDTCRSLGGNRLATVKRVLAETRGGVGAAVVAGFGRLIGEVGVAMMVGGNIRGLTRTMTTAIALETSKGEFELGLALGIVLLTVALTVNAIGFALGGRKV